MNALIIALAPVTTGFATTAPAGQLTGMMGAGGFVAALVALMITEYRRNRVIDGKREAPAPSLRSDSVNRGGKFSIPRQRVSMRVEI